MKMNETSIKKLQELFETKNTTFQDRKIIQYPYLFDITLNKSESSDETIQDISIIQQINSWTCDLTLECLEPLSCDVFRKAFQYSRRDRNKYIDTVNDVSLSRRFIDEFDYEQLVDYVEDIEPMKPYVPYPALDELEWTFNQQNIELLTKELYKLFNAEYVVAGKSFTEAVLKFGTLGHYYLQYLANGIFGHPNAVMAIQNRRQIISQIEEMGEQTSKHLSSQETYQDMARLFYLAITEMSPERWQDTTSQEIQFRRGDILECMVQLRGHIHSAIPIPQTRQGIAIQQTITQLFSQSSICDINGTLHPQLWKLRFILL